MTENRLKRKNVGNSRYPKIFDDETVGAEAKKLYKEAEVRLISFAE